MCLIYGNIIMIMIMFVNINICIGINFTLQRNPPDEIVNGAEQFYPYYFKLQIGSPSTSYYDIIFDTTTDYLWLTEKENLTSKTYNSTSKKDVMSEFYNISYPRNQIINGSFVNDNIYNHSSNLTIDFMLANTHPFREVNAAGMLGISRKNQTNSTFSFFSILKQHYNSNFKFNGFSLVHTGMNEGLLYIGERDTSIFSSQNNSTCKCVDNSEFNINISDFWNCKLTKVITNNEEILIMENDVAIFSAAEEMIYAPFDKGNTILNKYLSLLDKSGGKCSIVKNNNTQTILYCKKFDYDFLPDVGMVLKGKDVNEEISLTAIGEDLFRNENETHLQFKIIADSSISYWIFGEPLMKNYNFEFDFENKTITIVPYNIFAFYLIVIALSLGGFIVLVFLILLIKYTKSEENKGFKEKLQ